MDYINGVTVLETGTNLFHLLLDVRFFFYLSQKRLSWYSSLFFFRSYLEIQSPREIKRTAYIRSLV